jgi:hypothetical protein
MLVSPWMGGAGGPLEALGGAGLVAKPRNTEKSLRTVIVV